MRKVLVRIQNGEQSQGHRYRRSVYVSYTYIYIHMYEIHHGIQLYPMDIYHIIVYFQVTRKISLKLWSLEFRQNSGQTSLGFSTKGSTSAELWRVGLFQVARIHRDTLGKTQKTVGPQKIEDTRCWKIAVRILRWCTSICKYNCLSYANTPTWAMKKNAWPPHSLSEKFGGWNSIPVVMRLWDGGNCSPV